jgi:hypothetical protein
VEVGAPSIRLRAASTDQAGVLQRAQVVGKQVRGHAEPLLKQAGRGIAEGERINDAQTAEVGQRGV